MLLLTRLIESFHKLTFIFFLDWMDSFVNFSLEDESENFNRFLCEYVAYIAKAFLNSCLHEAGKAKLQNYEIEILVIVEYIPFIANVV